MLLYPFPASAATIPLPVRFNNPFCYQPHPLCVLAAGEVKRYLARQVGWQRELQQGKMFGVLVVQAEGQTAYLAAFSGTLDGKNRQAFFVPPVYDLLQPTACYAAEDRQISLLTARIRELQSSDTYTTLQQRLQEASRQETRTLDEAREKLRRARQTRDLQRQQALSPDEEALLIRQSQFERAEFKRLKQSLRASQESLQQQLQPLWQQLSSLETERKRRSAALQQQIFRQFTLLNARGESRSLSDIFREAVHRTPPSGAGECAAPKLLQCAYLHHYKPLALAEFWQGASPLGEVRLHNHYYPACQEKCKPILQYMLQGLDVDGF
jgi:tRNA pseudouridine32 synthase/23S rRNA pseudouridine746 synthase